MMQVTYDLAQQMSNTSRLLVQEMLQRGWQVSIPYWCTPHFYVDRGDGQILHLFSSSSPSLSFASALLANDKYATAQVLASNGVSQLPVYMIDSDMTDAAREFVAENFPVVVKPLDGSHGNGITTNVEPGGQLDVAVEHARSKSKSDKVLLQKQLVGDDLKDVRILIIDGRYVGAIHRVPARVFGDGKSTVEELILRENQQSHRGEPYKNKLATINIDAARTFLGDTLDRVAEEGEAVTVLGVANYGAGGELIDVTDIVPKWMRDESIRIAEVIGLPVAGVDYMVAGDIASITESSKDKATVIEVNKSPSLCIHDEPTVGENRGATKAYVDYLAGL